MFAALILSTVLVFEESTCQAADPPLGKPNILLIVADDMGYSDLGCFGGEIIPAWEKLTDEQRRQAARKMELYAAMIEYMDDQIGRLIGHLKKSGKYDNTLIVFLSDNGAAGEDMAELITKLAPTAKDWFDKTFDNRPENWGHPGSCVEYGPPWAQVSSVPFRLFKGVEAEGASVRPSS